MTWNVASGRITLAIKAAAKGAAMAPHEAANRVDEWFPSHDRFGIATLEEIVRALHVPFGARDEDGDELRAIVRRALERGDLVATEHRPVGGGGPKRDPAPRQRPYAPQPRAPDPESLRFRLVVHGSFEPIVHAKVTVRYDDGKKEAKTTDKNGEIFFTSKASRTFELIEVDEPFTLAEVKQTRG